MNKPNFELGGRVALITGAGRGIGLGIAEALASAGCAVAIQDLDFDAAEEQAGRLRGEGAKAIALGGDITDLTVPQRVVGEAVEKLGGLHILVNNASIQTPGNWLDVDLPTMEREARADMLSPLAFCQQAVPHMRRGGYGRIVNIGSIQAKMGNPHMMVYAMCKQALVNMTVGMARGLAKDRITVNLIAPGWYNTWRNRHDFSSEEDLKQKGQHIPLGRIGEPRDCGGVALLLCSEAGEYITGQSIYVDGGMSAR